MAGINIRTGGSAKKYGTQDSDDVVKGNKFFGLSKPGMVNVFRALGHMIYGSS